LSCRRRRAPHLRLGDDRDGVEAEAVEGLADEQASFGEMALDAPAAAVGDLVLGARREQVCEAEARFLFGRFDGFARSGLNFNRHRHHPAVDLHFGAVERNACAVVQLLALRLTGLVPRPRRAVVGALDRTKMQIDGRMCEAEARFLFWQVRWIRAIWSYF